MLAVLAHDLGKPSCTRREFKLGAMRFVSPGHEEAGAELAEGFLTSINTPAAVRERVVPLIANHLFRYQDLTDRAVRRLAKRLEPATIEDLCLVMSADSMGRPPCPPTVPEGVKRLLEKARELEVGQSSPRPILSGRHLMERGMPPGPAFKTILDSAYEAQLEGAFADLAGALEWFDKRG